MPTILRTERSGEVADRQIKDKNKQVELISKAFTNYLYTYGPILNIFRKYGVSLEDKKALDKYVSNRIAGLLLYD